MHQDEQYTILIAPDQISSIISYVDYLYQAGFVLLWASDETEFFQLADAEYPDLILLDINGSTQNRFTLCNQLKADTALQHIPVIFVGSRSSDRHVVAALAQGAVDFIRLPVTKAELIARVKTHVGTYHRYLQKELIPSKTSKQSQQLQTEPLSTERTDAHTILSKREQEIAELYSAGYSRSEISDRLGVTTNTTHWHLKQIYRKLNIRTKAELIAMLRVGT